MDQFPIGCWNYFPVENAYQGMVRDWHDLGLNNPLTPSFDEGADKDRMIRLLDECAEYGMKVFVWDERCALLPGRFRQMGGEMGYRAAFQRALDDFGSHPAVKGFYVGDEPDAPDAADYFAAARIQREMAPDLTPYLNLLPWFDWIGERIGAEAYAPYLDRAVKEANLKLLAYDCYTQMWPGDKGWDVYFNNLREHMLAGQRGKVPFCSTILCTGHYDYACPNQNDFRWQISTAVAMGAKGLSYFYVNGMEPHDNYRQYPINCFHERTQTFEWMSYENRLFQQRFGDILLSLTPVKQAFTQKAYGGLELFRPDEKLISAYGSEKVNLLIGRFADESGRAYWAVVNLDRTANTEANLRFARGMDLERRMFNRNFERADNRMDAVAARTEDGASIRMWLAPGQMELLREVR